MQGPEFDPEKKKKEKLIEKESKMITSIVTEQLHSKFHPLCRSLKTTLNKLSYISTW